MSTITTNAEGRVVGPTTEDDWYESIWRGEVQGFGEQHCTDALAEYRQDLVDLNAKRITPRRIIGAGRKRPLTAARQWLTDQIAEYETALATRGRNLSVNQYNVRSYLRQQSGAPKHV